MSTPHLTDIRLEEKPAAIRGILRDWCSGDSATEEQLTRLDEYVRAGIMDLSEASEVRYKWFRKGEFPTQAAWDDWTHMMEQLLYPHLWAAYKLRN